jgi:UDP-N-acetylmuramoylalanine--D-glutamate ligase
LIPVTTFAGKKVAVFGLGKSGMLSAEALSKGGAEVVVFDDNPKSLADARNAGLKTQDLRALDWSTVAALVLAPGLPLTHPSPHWTVPLARRAGVEIIGDIELFCREFNRFSDDCMYVAVTGTNGKSTTTALIAHLLQSAGRDAQIGGNIGVPVLALEPFAPGRVYVLEVSSYQIDLAPSLHPSIGILINISPDHLDRHGTLENYAAVKEQLVANAEVSLVGVDDELSDAIGRRLSERRDLDIIPVSAERELPWGYFVSGTKIVSKGNDQTIEQAEVLGDLAGITTLRGTHNAQNAAFACAAAWHCGLTPAEIAGGLKTFPGLAHRMQPVGRKGRVLFVNDSKATNADSAARALASFTDIFWIAGGKAKTGGIASLAEFFPRIRKAYLIGEAAPEFAKTLDGKVPHEVNGVLSTALAAAARDAEACDAKEPVVLLSPACASFDQYANFEVRGQAFIDLVLAMPGVSSLAQ